MAKTYHLGGRKVSLSPLEIQILSYMRSNSANISQRGAMIDLGITSASLSRRITDLKHKGLRINTVRYVNTITNRRYTKYFADYSDTFTQYVVFGV